MDVLHYTWNVYDKYMIHNNIMHIYIHLEIDRFIHIRTDIFILMSLLSSASGSKDAPLPAFTLKSRGEVGVLRIRDPYIQQGLLFWLLKRGSV